MPSLEVENLRTGFHEKLLISNLSFKIQEAAFIAVAGHNGSGKSTFFKCLIKNHPYEGNILINGLDIQSCPDLFKTGCITLLEQKNHVNFNIPVRDLILMGRFRFTRTFGDYSSKDEAVVNEVMESLGITALQDKDYLNLSGGEQQLVWLAQIFAQDTEIILLDEPSQQLDVYNRNKIFDRMQYWAYRKGKILLCITHDLDNLIGMKGYILNLSEPSPVLEILSEETVRRKIQYLEKGKHLSHSGPVA